MQVRVRGMGELTCWSFYALLCIFMNVNVFFLFPEGIWEVGSIPPTCNLRQTAPKWQIRLWGRVVGKSLEKVVQVPSCDCPDNTIVRIIIPIFLGPNSFFLYFNGCRSNNETTQLLCIKTTLFGPNIGISMYFSPC